MKRIAAAAGLAVFRADRVADAADDPVPGAGEPDGLADQGIPAWLVVTVGLDLPVAAGGCRPTGGRPVVRRE